MNISDTQKKILEIGKQEFLQKGFKDASLRCRFYAGGILRLLPR